MDSLYGLERGLAASSDMRAEITELVSQLEAANPTPQVIPGGGRCLLPPPAGHARRQSSGACLCLNFLA